GGLSGQKAAGHFEQMYESRCFRESKGQLGCNSCHNPHALPAPEEESGYYRSRCLSCHEKKPCTRAPVARSAETSADNCIDCHMQRGPSKIAHTALTDHRIPRLAQKTTQPPKRPQQPPAGESPLIPFHHDPSDPLDAETSRDLGLALVDLASSYP